MPSYQKIVWMGLVVVVIAILALAYFLFLAPQAGKKEAALPETSSLPAPPSAAPVTAAENDANIAPLELDLDRSDGAVREMVAAEEIPAAMKGWLQQKEIVRTVVAAVDSIARGESPAAQLPFLAPAAKFSASEKNGTFFIDPRSFRRYDPLVNAFTAIPDKTWIMWYRKLRPTLEKAFAELGYPGITFAQRLRQAIEQLIQAPLPRENAVLEKKIICYAYADAGLENLSPAQKHLLRLGPENAARIQGKLRALAAALSPSGK
jgi:hypothetical protein